jgi:hypothetical protein
LALRPRRGWCGLTRRGCRRNRRRRRTLAACLFDKRTFDWRSFHRRSLDWRSFYRRSFHWLFGWRLCAGYVDINHADRTADRGEIDRLMVGGRSLTARGGAAANI